MAQGSVGPPARPPDDIDGTPVQPASAADLAAIQFAAEAETFERRLASYLLSRADVQEQIRVVVAAVWERANDEQRRALGTDDFGTPGAVGAELGLLRRIVESGNARERMTMFYLAIHTRTLERLLGQDFGRAPRSAP